ncbi:MAG: type II secretion system protein [Lachnospiraceae bacterium]|nr:type II secretion system protein [Lachnospiraceae bacterium]
MKYLSTKNEKGFTLVELIVVIVILAILAAILVPALLGYIDKAKKSEDLEKAKLCMTSMQSVLVELYAKDQPACIEHNGQLSKPNENGTQFTWYNPWRFGDFANMAELDYNKSTNKYNNQPANLVLLVGHYGVYGSQKRNVGITVTEADKKKAFTCYGVIYQRTEDSEPLFFDGTNWNYGKVELKEKNYTPYLTINGEDIFVQCYFICDSKSSNVSAALTYLKNWSK